MQCGTDLQFYYVIADPKIHEKHNNNNKTKYSKCNGFEITSNLLNSDNLKVAINQLYNELQV